MATIVTRAGKGSPLTNTEVDANFTNLNTDKAELSGAAFTGAITTNSTVDGRDVATDGTKLDTVETNADVTDATNVTAAGALMDSELTSIASVKALDQGVATGDSPTFAGITLATADINSGTIDGTTIGASSASTGAFTTLTSTGLTVNNTTAFSYLPVSTAGSVVGTIGTGSGTIFNTPSVNASYGSGLAIDGSYASDLSSVNVKAFGPKFSSYGSELNLFTSDDTSLLKRQTIASNGDISFYEDTGTTAKFFWDASAESLGIGVTSAPSRLTVKSPDNTLATNIAQFDSLNGGAGFKFGYQRIEQIGATVPITFETGGSESMRIDSSGNVGIGITPATLLDIKEGTAATDAIIGLTAGTGGRAQIRSEAQADNTSSELSFHTMGGSSTAERMRIDSSGNLLVGTTASTARLAVKSNAGAILGFGVYGDTAGDTAYNIAQFGKFDNNTTTSQVFVNFVVNNGAAANGQINANGSGAVAFGSWSDSRLKENITDLPNQLANITALRPVEFDYIESEGGGHQLGFIAQEVEEIYPDLVGERQDGMKTLSGLSKWDARLVKAIQEQQTLIESLTTRIAALEE